jgi:hypothetical protein
MVGVDALDALSLFGLSNRCQVCVMLELSVYVGVTEAPAVAMSVLMSKFNGGIAGLVISAAPRLVAAPQPADSRALSAWPMPVAANPHKGVAR